MPSRTPRAAASTRSRWGSIRATPPTPPAAAGGKEFLRLPGMAGRAAGDFVLPDQFFKFMAALRAAKLKHAHSPFLQIHGPAIRPDATAPAQL